MSRSWEELLLQLEDEVERLLLDVAARSRDRQPMADVIGEDRPTGPVPPELQERASALVERMSILERMLERQMNETSDQLNVARRDETVPIYIDAHW